MKADRWSCLTYGSFLAANGPASPLHFGIESSRPVRYVDLDLDCSVGLLRAYLRHEERLLSLVGAVLVDADPGWIAVACESGYWLRGDKPLWPPDVSWLLSQAGKRRNWRGAAVCEGPDAVRSAIGLALGVMRAGFRSVSDCEIWLRRDGAPFRMLPCDHSDVHIAGLPDLSHLSESVARLGFRIEELAPLAPG